MVTRLNELKNHTRKHIAQEEKMPKTKSKNGAEEEKKRKKSSSHTTMQSTMEMMAIGKLWKLKMWKRKKEVGGWWFMNEVCNRFEIQSEDSINSSHEAWAE